MKVFLTLISLLFFPYWLIAQHSNFPENWQGEWQGNLMIYMPNQAQEIPMQLTILPLEKDKWSWIIDYKIQGQTPRQYELIQENNAWKIDEKNGIILPQTLINNRLTSAFEVMGNLLLCAYWLEGESLHMEIQMIAAKSTTTTGFNNDISPIVNIHTLGLYQKAVLYKK